MTQQAYTSVVLLLGQGRRLHQWRWFDRYMNKMVYYVTLKHIPSGNQYGSDFMFFSSFCCSFVCTSFALACGYCIHSLEKSGKWIPNNWITGHINKINKGKSLASRTMAAFSKHCTRQRNLIWQFPFQHILTPPYGNLSTLWYTIHTRYPAGLLEMREG